MSDKDKVAKMKIEKIGTINARIVRLYEEGNRKFLALEFIRPNKKITYNVNQMGFAKINDFSQNNTSYAKSNLFSILLIILFENFILKDK